jgi:hypothetical protein
LDLASALVANLRKIPLQMLDPVPRRAQVKPGADPLEKPGVPLRPQDHPKQLPSDPGVVDQAAAYLDQTDPLAGPSRQGPVGEESQGNVPIPDPAHQSREALQATIVPLQISSRGFRKESNPDGDPDP